MIVIHKKIVTDENGNPSDVIIPWDEFQEIVELLGLDLDEQAVGDLRQARKDREGGNISAYTGLDDI
jgi:hypothetical protein